MTWREWAANVVVILLDSTRSPLLDVESTCYFARTSASPSRNFWRANGAGKFLAARETVGGGCNSCCCLGKAGCCAANTLNESLPFVDIVGK